MVKNIQLRRLPIFQIRAALNCVANISPVLQYPGISSLDESQTSSALLVCVPQPSRREIRIDKHFGLNQKSVTLTELSEAPSYNAYGSRPDPLQSVPVVRLPALRHLAIGMGADVQLSDMPEVPARTVSLQSFDLHLEN